MNGDRYYFLVKFRGLDDSGVKALEEMLSEKIEYRNRKINWGGFSSSAMLYEADRAHSSISLILFELSGHMRRASETKLAGEISENLRGLFDVKVSKISSEDLSKRRPEIEKRILTALASRCMRCDGSSAALTLKSEEQILGETADVAGWSEFRETLTRIARRMDNDASGRLNLNAAFIVEAENRVGDHIRALYDFYFARGAVSVPYIYYGDWDDASMSPDGGFMYVVTESVCETEGVIVFGRRSVSESLRSLRSKKNAIVVCELTKKEYESVAGDPLFDCVFPTVVNIAEPTAEEKLAFVKKEAAAYNFELSPDIVPETLNGAALDKLRASLVKAVSSRLEEETCSYTLTASDLAAETKPVPVSSPFEELDALIGLESVKSTVREIAAFVERRGKTAGLCLHMVFRGRPGTGKTTVARIIGKIFGAAGVIENPNKFVEADRSTLVSKYLGGTAPRVKDVVTAALGGVLFIDEAYSLFQCSGSDYGHEAVATLVKLMEDHRKDFVCILAGYPDEMDEMLDMNPGMRGRVQFYIDFPDYSAAEMLEIFDSMCRAEGYAASEGARAALEEFFEKLTREEDFANGRTVRRVFEQIRIKQAVRSERMDIEEEDVRAVMEAMPLRGASHRARAIGFLDVA